MRDCQKRLSTAFFDNKVPRRRRKLHILRSRLRPRAQSFRCSSSPTKCILRFVGSRRPMETCTALRRCKLHILRSRLKPRAQSFRCSSSPQKALRLSGDPSAFFGLQVIPTASKCGVTGVLFVTAFASIPPPTGRENPPDSPGLSHRQICGFFDGDEGCGGRVLPANSPCPPATGACHAPVHANREKLTLVLISSAGLV